MFWEAEDFVRGRHGYTESGKILLLLLPCKNPFLIFGRFFHNPFFDSRFFDFGFGFATFVDCDRVFAQVS